MSVVIYKIIPKEASVRHSYVGSTTNFQERLIGHRGLVERPSGSRHDNTPLYCTIRETGGWDAWQMIPIEECEEAARAVRERYWIDEIRATLNVQKPGRTTAEWRADNAEYRTEQQREYYLANKERLNARQKKYVADHAEQVAAYKRRWVLQNAEKLQYRNSSVLCECGQEYSYSNKQRHLRSRVHHAFISASSSPSAIDL